MLVTRRSLGRPQLRPACLAVALLASRAFAAEPAPPEPRLPSLATGDRIVSVGLLAIGGPRYLGAERYGPFASPSLDLRRPDQPAPLTSPDDGLGVAVIDTPRFRVGPVASLRQGRSAHVDRRFAGLDRSPWTVEAGAFADYWLLPDRLRTRAELRHGVGGRDGLALDLSADLFGRAGPVTVSIGPRLGFLDAGLAQLQFGVSPAAALRNPLFAPYTARGGLQRAGLSSALDVDWSDAWRSTLYARYDHLLGDAAASTITRRIGATDQFTAGVGLTYSFHLDVPVLP